MYNSHACTIIYVQTVMVNTNIDVPICIECMTFLIDIRICYSDYQSVNFHVVACIYGCAIHNLHDSYKKMYGERLGDGVEYHLMKPTPRC